MTTLEPVRTKPYPLPLHLRDAFDEEVQKLLDLSIIEPSDSDYVSPCVMVKKPDNTYRLCIDYRKLNAITQFDCEPIPSTEENLDIFHNSKYITELDLAKAYYQIPLKCEVKKYTAFATRQGLMQFTRLPFGLVTACGSFNRLIRRVLFGLKGVCFYFDNIYVASHTWKDHLHALFLVLQRLRKHNLTVGPSKCHIGFSSIDYLGFRVGLNQLSVQEEKVKAISEMTLPSTKKQLRSFLGAVSFYRKFIKNFASISAPLTDLLQKRKPDVLVWNEPQMQAFQTLKSCLIEAPILHLPDPQKTFGIQTDASNTGIGACLVQFDTDGTPQPLAYASRKLLPRERAYPIIEKECLAIVWAIQRFKFFLEGKKFVIQTDHQPLAYLKKVKDKNARLMRYSLFLMSYDFSISYLKGSENSVADALSRNSLPDEIRGE